MKVPVLVLMACGMMACSNKPVAEISKGPIAERVIAAGVVEARGGVARVRAPSIGRITEVRVEEGSKVAAGDTLAVMDAENVLLPETLTAPIAGVVIKRRVSPGDDVSRGEGALFEIADPAQIRVRFELEDEDQARVEVGYRAQVIPKGQSRAAPIAEAEVTRLGATMEARRSPEAGSDAPSAAPGRLIRAGWVDVSPSAALVLGREVEVIIVLPPTEVEARAPRSAVFVREGQTVVSRPGTFGDTDVRVELGKMDGEYVEVTGIEAGAKVVTR